MSIEPNGANIEAIIAQQNSQETSRRTKIGRMFGAAVALTTIGVGANAMIDETPTIPVVEAADCDDEDVALGDVCDGQVIVYEDPIESVPPVTNVSGVTLPNKGTPTTFMPSTTTTEKPNHTTTTIPRTTTTTIPRTTTTVGNTTTTTIPRTTTTVGNTTTTEFMPSTTTTEKPNHTTTTIPRPPESTSTIPGDRPPVISAAPTN